MGELEFDVILPGHGQPFRDREKINHFQPYLADFWTKVVELHRSGVPAEEAARRIDMREHACVPDHRRPGLDGQMLISAFYHF